MARLSKSPWILHYDAASCNGCDIETLACLTPLYDVERLGVVNTGNPKHADIFLVTGAVNEQARGVLETIYGQMPDPKVVVAVGACASTGGIFCDCYNISGGVDTVIPVDVYVPGCAARPEAIIDGVAKALGVLEAKDGPMREALLRLGELAVAPAGPDDGAAIGAIERAMAGTEREIHGAEAGPGDAGTGRGEAKSWKATVRGTLVGAARAAVRDGTVEIDRVAVHPFFRGRGVTERLVEAAESGFPGAALARVFVGASQKRRIGRLARIGYSEPVAAGDAGTVFLEKELA
jgi:ech hydrogenase subunit C